mgnify:CR=1 FL=1
MPRLPAPAPSACAAWTQTEAGAGAPADCLWGGGRAGFGECGAREALALAQEYGVSARLTFSNSLLREEHLSDRKCNALCELFSQANGVQNGVIVHSELLTDYLRTRYPALYLVSSTTKVLTDFEDFPARAGQGRISVCRAGFSIE